MKRLKKWNLPGPKQIKGLLFLFLALQLLTENATAQSHFLVNNHLFNSDLEAAILRNSERLPASMKPLLLNDAYLGMDKLDSIQPLLACRKETDRSLFARKLFFEHLFILDTGKIKLTLDPLYHFEYTYEKDNTSETLYKNSRGFLFRLQIGEKLAVESSFRENQARLPGYIVDRVEATDVAYGQGRVKKIGPANYDFSMASSYLSYSPSDQFNISFGQGKHFIGSGFRSHLLSDLAYNYPFLRFRLKSKDRKLNYQNLYSIYQDLLRVPSVTLSENLFSRKFSASHYLNWSISKNINLGLFEKNIWPLLDSSGRSRPGLNAYFPVILFNTFVEDDESMVASLLGLDFNYRINRELLFYSQLTTSDLNDGIRSYQLGLNYYPNEHWRFSVEYNEVLTDSISNLFHYSESLNLPYVMNQTEFIASAQYRNKRMRYQARSNFFSGNQEQWFNNFEIAYVVNPAVNSTLFIDLTHRDVDDLLLIAFGWRTNLQNLYFNY